MEIWYVKDGDKVETFPNQIRKKELVKKKIFADGDVQVGRCIIGFD
jgi:hypothetical protein